eukprot:gene13318-13447_t
MLQGPELGDFITSEELYSLEAPGYKKRKRKPDWMKRVIPSGNKYTEIKAKLRELKLHTVCEEARCPNIDEPENVSKAIAAWGLDYVVLTSVDRDDLPDGGAAHIAQTIRLLKQKTEGRLLVEALVPDFQGSLPSIQQVATSGLDVFAHNVETVERLQGVVRDRRANWKQSLGVLSAAKEAGVQITKTSIMLGCGEHQEEVLDAFRQLRDRGVDVVTLGQYMRPTKKHMAVSSFLTPAAFSAYQQAAEEMGFLYVASGPMANRARYWSSEYGSSVTLQGLHHDRWLCHLQLTPQSRAEELKNKWVHLHFVSRALHRQHYNIFPKAVGQLLEAIPFEQVELSLTQGRWQHHRWRRPKVPVHPAGAELRAEFAVPPLPEQNEQQLLRSRWRRLSRALGGLFCASLNFVARAEATALQVNKLVESSPACDRKPSASALTGAAGCAKPAEPSDPSDGGSGGSAGGTQAGPPAPAAAGVLGDGRCCSWVPSSSPDRSRQVLYATLPQEATCTENLTPWLKLLPCRDAAGVGRLLQNRSAVFGAEYHSLYVKLQVHRDSSQHIMLSSITQSFAMVLKTNSKGPAGSKDDSSSNSNGEFTRRMSELDLAQLLGTEEPEPCPAAHISRLYVEAPQLQDSGAGSSSSSRTVESRKANSFLGVYDLLMRYRLNRGRMATKSLQQQPQQPFIQLQWPEAAKAAANAVDDDADDVSGSYLAVAHYTTGTGSLHGGVVLQLTAVGPAAGATPGATARSAPNPPAGHSVPSADERCADGAGVAGPAGNVTVCLFQVVPWYIRLWLHTLQLSLDAQLVVLSDHLLLHHISPGEDRQQPLVYSNGLVTSLAVPDFSMPYNVVCLTSTVLAVFMGAFINSLLQRHGLQERLEAAGPEMARALQASKLRKVLAIVVLFGALGYFLDPALQQQLAEQWTSLGLLQF